MAASSQSTYWTLPESIREANTSSSVDPRSSHEHRKPPESIRESHIDTPKMRGTSSKVRTLLSRQRSSSPTQTHRTKKEILIPTMAELSTGTALLLVVVIHAVCAFCTAKSSFTPPDTSRTKPKQQRPSPSMNKTSPKASASNSLVHSCTLDLLITPTVAAH